MQKTWFMPAVTATVGVVLLAAWFFLGAGKPLALRVPGTDRAPGAEFGTNVNPVLLGKALQGDGQPANLPGAWPQFRGTNSLGAGDAATPLANAWAPGEPRELWGIDTGEGYAGPAVWNGRVYLMDYDREKKQDALRCLSLADGREIWRFAYPVAVKRNHGMSRTVPAVADGLVVAMGPKCHVVCVDATSGQLKWGIDLAQEYGTTIPQWYAGQCPLIENGRVILAPGGTNAVALAAADAAGKDTNGVPACGALMAALDLQTGKPLWLTPNPNEWKMTHASIVSAEFESERMYVYCADKGVVGVSAKDGRLLWETTAWKISIATVPSPLVVGNGRIFFSGGYNAGSLMLQLKKDGDSFVPEVAFKLPPEVFGATQHTPVLFQDHIYGVRPDGRFVCLSLDGKTVWASDSTQLFGLGGFLLADGKLFAMNDSGLLRMLEASPAKYNLLGQAQVLKGRESWGPPAIAGSRLLARDFTRLVCLDVGRK